jgi:hypothetical protein
MGYTYFCKSSEAANNKYLALCDKWDSVKLTDYPRFSDEGWYTWNCN